MLELILKVAAIAARVGLVALPAGDHSMKATFIYNLEKPTVADYLRQIQDIEKGEWCDHTIYRGHAKEKWGVTPELLRKPGPKSRDTCEKVKGMAATRQEDRM